MFSISLLPALKALHVVEQRCARVFRILAFLAGAVLCHLYHRPAHVSSSCSPPPTIPSRIITTFSIIRCFEEIFTQMEDSEGIGLQSVTIALHGMDLQGIVERPQYLSAWISALEKLCWTGKITLGQLRSDLKKNQSGHCFQIHIDLNDVAFEGDDEALR